LYDELYEAWLKEKGRSELQSLPRDFYSRLAAYIKRIQEEGRMLDKKTVKGRAIMKEAENAKRLIAELAETRLQKIMDAVMRGDIVSVALLSEEEAQLYDNISAGVEAYRNMVERVLRGQQPKIEKKRLEKDMIVVRILKNVPAIVGVDMKTYGPFKPEDIATLPQENARLLIRQGVAVEVETA